MTDDDPLARFIAPMLGLPAWGVKQGYGSFLTFEFGEPRLIVHEWRSREEGPRRDAYASGRWHLWIYCCAWRVLRDGGVLARSKDEDVQIAKGAHFLNGQKLSSVEAREGRSTFRFDLGGVLETWPYGDNATDEQWTIITETEAFAYRADDCYSLGSVTVPVGERTWQPLRESGGTG